MNKKIGLGILGIIVLGAIIIGVMMGSKKEAPVTPVAPTPQQPAVVTPPPSEPTKGQSVLKDLFLSKAQQECTYKSKGQATEQISGVINTDGVRMRTNFTSTSKESPVKGDMIMRDGYMYTWVNGMSTGMKIKLDQNNGFATSKNDNVDYNQDVDVECKPWSPDPLAFELPGNVTFQEIVPAVPSQAPQNSTNSVAPKGTNECAICDATTGEARTQCRQALNCK